MKGIPFKAWEVQALQAGRLRAIVRMVKPQFTTDRVYSWMTESRNKIGKPGERFFVREAWRFYDWTEDGYPKIEFRSDGEKRWFEDLPESGQWIADTWERLSESPNFEKFNAARDPYFRSPVTMPEWAARFRPLIESVKVCRVNDLSEVDAIACGCTHTGLNGIAADEIESAREQFIRQFNDDNGNYDANPWVWFVRITNEVSQ